MKLEVEVDQLLIISDLHLGNPASQAAANLPALLDEVLTPDWTLCINGDAVDLTQGTVTGIARDLRPVVKRLRDFSRAGGRLLYAIGNHDLVFEHFLTELPFEVAPFFNVRCGDHRIRVEHGHAYEPTYARYPGLYELGGRMAKPLLVAHADVYRLWSTTQRAVDRWRRGSGEYPHHVAADALFERGFDVAVFGHTHLPEVTEREGGTFVNCGDWLRDTTLVRVTAAGVSLERLVETEDGLAVQRFAGRRA
ncbi:MAG: metallophosphoesterase [Nitriliruptorales bacterium]|nr:metallophosphoesterase [Nitriliruptorales bacterium]